MAEQVQPQGLVRAMDEGDLAVVLAWRNDPEVRRHMFSRGEIGAAEHRAWFEQHRADARRRLLVYEADGVPLGFVSLQLGRQPQVAAWGFYAAPGAARGTGRAMGRLALDFGFDTLALHKVCGQALADNRASIALHRALGFREEGVLREHHFDGERRQDVVCFGLLAHERAATGARAHDV